MSEQNATPTVSNPSRFAMSQPHRQAISSSFVDVSKDIDLVFLKAVKECRYKWNSIELIQSLPASPLSDFHLHWLVKLADFKPESRSIIQHIFTSYKIECDPVILDYYNQQLHRILEENRADETN